MGLFFIVPIINLMNKNIKSYDLFVLTTVLTNNSKTTFAWVFSL